LSRSSARDRAFYGPGVAARFLVCRLVRGAVERHQPLCVSTKGSAEAEAIAETFCHACKRRGLVEAQIHTQFSGPAQGNTTAATHIEIDHGPPVKGNHHDPQGQNFEQTQAHEADRGRRRVRRAGVRWLWHRQRNRGHRLGRRVNSLVHLGNISPIRAPRRGIQRSVRTGRRGIIRHGRQRTIVSGTAAYRPTEAALAAYPGGVVDRVVKLSNGEYEVHNIGVNWPHHIFVNQNFKVVGAN
jgi:hypothetical protein